MARRVHRPLFRRHYEFVAVRPIRLTRQDVIQPGETIDPERFRLYHLRSLYQRRRIGVKGTPWTEAMLAELGNAHARPEVVASETEEVQHHDASTTDAGTLEDAVAAAEELVLVPDAQEATTQDAGSLEGLVAGSGDDKGDQIEIIEGDKGWRTIMLNGKEVAKKRGEAGVQEWLRENGYGEA